MDTISGSAIEAAAKVAVETYDSLHGAVESMPNSTSSANPFPAHPDSRNTPVVAAELGVGSLQAGVTESLRLLDTIPVGYIPIARISLHSPPTPPTSFPVCSRFRIPFLDWLCWDEFLDLAIATVFG